MLTGCYWVLTGYYGVHTGYYWVLTGYYWGTHGLLWGTHGVLLGYSRATIGHSRATIGHSRAAIGYSRATMGYTRGTIEVLTGYYGVHTGYYGARKYPASELKEALDAAHSWMDAHGLSAWARELLRRRRGRALGTPPTAGGTHRVLTTCTTSCVDVLPQQAEGGPYLRTARTHALCRR